jgi:hypothetical protein
MNYIKHLLAFVFCIMPVNLDAASLQRFSSDQRLPTVDHYGIEDWYAEYVNAILKKLSSDGSRPFPIVQRGLLQ